MANRISRSIVLTLIATAIVTSGLALSGCCIQHKWEEANCTYPKTCSECGVTEGEPLGDEGHVWQEATCEDPKTCEICGETEGEALGHDWQEQTYREPKTCKRCSETEGKSLEEETDDLINDLKSELPQNNGIHLKGTIRFH